MKRLFTAAQRQLSLPLILCLVIGLNIYWGVTLNAFGTHFEAIAGTTLLDLENINGILSPSAAAAHISTYSSEAKSLYWVFFVLDNLMPPLVFGSFILLWLYCLARIPYAWAQWMTHSPLMYVPLGVGLFDLCENLAFVTAISAVDPIASIILPALSIGIGFTYLKVSCLFATFGITLGLVVVALIKQGTAYRQRSLAQQ